MKSLFSIPALSQGEPIILYELNEVPWRVVDWYVAQQPRSAFARLLKSSANFTTLTRDEGELHPWTTWPTLHRGVTSSVHRIRFINQCRVIADNNFPPIWHTLRLAGKRVGVFGSLQSYPPNMDGEYEFYIPDTFSPGAETWPLRYTAFQRFNLRQTKLDGATANRVHLDLDILWDLAEMLGSGLRKKTVSSLLLHLAKETVNTLHRSRRPAMQALVSFDFFFHALNCTQPEFCTFFTNHVAGMMHRYWKYTFPEDFSVKLSSSEDFFHAQSILYAMNIADTQLARLMEYVISRRGRLILASSMGQEAIHRGLYRGEWRITDVRRFLRAVGWIRPAHNLLAMQPDFNFAFSSEAEAMSFVRVIQCLADAKGNSIWKRVQCVGSTVNLGLSPSEEALANGVVWFTPDGFPRTPLPISDIGIERLSRDPGTGYHQPLGVLMIFGNGVVPCGSRQQVDSTDVRSAILKMFGLDCLA
jgi:hypothetical protein